MESNPKINFSSMHIFSLPQRCKNGCREAIWGRESPPSGAIDPHGPPASAASTSVSLDAETGVPDPGFVPPPGSDFKKK